MDDNNKKVRIAPTIIAVILLTIIAGTLYLISKSNALENIMLIGTNGTVI